MPPVSRSEDVYRHFVEDADEDWLFGLVCFALFEEQRIEWMRHYEENNGGAPSSSDIEHWYEQQSPGVLLRTKGQAENALQLYADDVLREVLEAERREVSEGVIVDEIRLAGRFWPQFGINVAAGVVSAFLFAVVLTVLALVFLVNASPVEIGKAIFGASIEENINGKTDDK